MIVNQNRDTFEYIKSLGLEVEHLKNNLEDQKIDVKCITQAIESLKNPRVDSIDSDICDMKNIVQELKAQIQNTTRQEISTDKFTIDIEPISQKDRKINGGNKGTKGTWNKKSTRLFNTAKANWSIFRDVFKEGLKNDNITEIKVNLIKTTNDLEDILEKYIKQVSIASKRAIPPISKKINTTCTPWWTKELGAERRDLIRLRRRIRFANARRKPFLIQEFTAAKEKYVSNIMSTITASWKELCTKQEKETIWQSIYRIIRKCTTTNEDKLLRLGEKTLNPDDSAKLLAKVFYPEDEVNKDTEEQGKVRDESNAIIKDLRYDSINFPKFTEEEIKMVLQRISPKKGTRRRWYNIRHLL
ncbi:unnamed protein product [Parnassius apollo]|uniref:(apollo) hypothetical protein n=1 Tax=Parnassius apollo TaxID=110799 RepID=A0A8S3X1J1_PARAO|nr:unnamed protein product [Parnassius apollo]